jgi:hypothetical protein
MYKTQYVNALLPLKFSSRPHPLQSSRIIFPYVHIPTFQAARSHGVCSLSRDLQADAIDEHNEIGFALGALMLCVGHFNKFIESNSTTIVLAN